MMKFFEEPVIEATVIADVITDDQTGDTGSQFSGGEI